LFNAFIRDKQLGGPFFFFVILESKFLIRNGKFRSPFFLFTVLENKFFISDYQL